MTRTFSTFWKIPYVCWFVWWRIVMHQRHVLYIPTWESLFAFLFSGRSYCRKHHSRLSLWNGNLKQWAMYIENILNITFFTLSSFFAMARRVFLIASRTPYSECCFKLHLNWNRDINMTKITMYFSILIKERNKCK